MKISSNLLKAMVVTITLSAGTGCVAIKPKSNSEVDRPSLLKIFQPGREAESCPACGMG